MLKLQRVAVRGWALLDRRWVVMLVTSVFALTFSVVRLEGSEVVQPASWSPGISSSGLPPRRLVCRSPMGLGRRSVLLPPGVAAVDTAADRFWNHLIRRRGGDREFPAHRGPDRAAHHPAGPFWVPELRFELGTAIGRPAAFSSR
jgi:hypothetical protein